MAPVILLHAPYKTPVRLLDRLKSCVPMTRSWAWFWKSQQALLGPRKIISLNGSVVSLQDTSREALSRFSLGEPDFSDSKGVQVWLLDKEALRTLRAKLQINLEVAFMNSHSIT